jgi:hypothetical protein
MWRPLSFVVFCLLTVFLVSGGSCSFDEDADQDYAIAELNGNFVPAQFLTGPVSHPSDVPGPIPVWTFPWGLRD